MCPDTGVTYVPGSDRWLEGEVRTRRDGAPIAGALVSHAPPEWPPALCRSWGTSTTGIDGRYHVLTPTAVGGPLSVEIGGVQAWEGEAAPGRALRIELDNER